ncbi:MAG: hypothetical protein M1587_07300 [Thaumarchaeota archaeon]|nr:hypothetical protein [Nitrososphaerota archaeon]
MQRKVKASGGYVVYSANPLFNYGLAAFSELMFYATLIQAVSMFFLVGYLIMYWQGLDTT